MTQITCSRPDNTDDVIDVRDIIDRAEDLRENENRDEDEAEEISALDALLEELSRGNGGDHQWDGDWYPVTLIRDSYFEDYAQELAEELDLIKENTQWPYTCIDWKQAARELKTDYSSAEFDGVTYWYR